MNISAILTDRTWFVVAEICAIFTAGSIHVGFFSARKKYWRGRLGPLRNEADAIRWCAIQSQSDIGFITGIFSVLLGRIRFWDYVFHPALGDCEQIRNEILRAGGDIGSVAQMFQTLLDSDCSDQAHYGAWLLLDTCLYHDKLRMAGHPVPAYCAR